MAVDEEFGECGEYADAIEGSECEIYLGRKMEGAGAAFQRGRGIVDVACHVCVRSLRAGLRSDGFLYSLLRKGGHYDEVFRCVTEGVGVGV